MESIFVSTRKIISKTQVILDCKFSIDSDNEVEKILAVNSVPVILTKNCLDNKITYSGKLSTSLLYETKNGRKIEVINVSDFNETLIADVSSGENVNIECKIIDITTPSIKTNEVKVACIIEILPIILVEKEISCNITAENVITKTNELILTNFVQSINETFEFAEKIKIQDSLNQILKIDTNPSITKCQCKNGFITVDLDVFVCISYLDEFDNVKFYQELFSFSQEFQAEDSIEEDNILLNILPLSHLSKTVVSQENNYNLISYSLTLQCLGEIFHQSVYNNIVDAYSTTDLISYKKQEISGLSTLNNVFFTNSFTGKVNLLNENDNVLGFVNPNCEIINSLYENEKTTIEGIISSTILYSKTSNNEENIADSSTYSLIAEIPFTVTYQGEFAVSNIHCGIKNFNFHKDQNSLEIEAKINFWGNVEQKCDFENLTEVCLKSKKPLSPYAFEIFIAEEDIPLWDLCKKIGAKQEDILNQNKNISEPIKKGTKILHYNNLQ